MKAHLDSECYLNTHLNNINAPCPLVSLVSLRLQRTVTLSDNSSHPFSTRNIFKVSEISGHRCPGLSYLPGTQTRHFLISRAEKVANQVLIRAVQQFTSRVSLVPGYLLMSRIIGHVAACLITCHRTNNPDKDRVIFWSKNKITRRQ